MAITTLDGIIGGMLTPEFHIKVAFTGEAAGQFHSSFYLAGSPGAAVAPTPGINGAALTSYAGQLAFPAAVGGQNIYLARASFTQSGSVGGMILCDRLWHNSGIAVTTTTAQAITTPTWPARDGNGATAGNDINVGIEVSTATTNASAITNTTMSYTNSDGVAGRTATIPSFPATAAVGTFVKFMLQAGDRGVQSIQSVTLGTSYGGGAIHLVAYRPIVSIPAPVVNAPNDRDAIALGFPRMYDNSVPFALYQLSGTAGGATTIELNYAQG